MTSTAGLTTTWADASALVVRSDVTAVLVSVLLFGAWVAAGALRVRAAIPGAPPSTCVAAGPNLLLDLRIRRHGQTGHTAGLGAAAGSVSLLVLGAGSAGALTLLLVRGHFAPGFTAATAASAAALLVAAVSVAVARRARHAKEAAGPWLTSRGPHLGVATMVGELALAGSVVAVALALAHTEGADISALEVFAATTVARLLTLLRHPVGGMALADLVLAGLLLGVGTAAAVAVATAALWRLGMVAAWVGSLLIARRSTVSLDGFLSAPQEPTGSAVGELVHRALFRMIASLPDPLARGTRRLVFQAKFSGADDPWQYETMPYEVRKRSLLVASIPPGAKTILELGCADGHNLRAWGEMFPGAGVIGLDISDRAVEAARRRAGHLPNVSAIQSDLTGAVIALQRAGVPRVDVVVLAEVLYYLGRPADIRRQLQPLASALAPDCLILLLHPIRDATALHAATFAALGAAVETNQVMPDAIRPVPLQTGRRTTPHPTKEHLDPME